MKKFSVLLIINVIVVLSFASKKNILNPLKIDSEIVIDGNLTEGTWLEGGSEWDFITFSPTQGEKLPFPTTVWMAYDEKNLYFAFKCKDPEPDLIKTSIAKRDSIGRDDWVGIIIDPIGNLQSSYEFYINPDGIQDDGVTSSVNDESFDQSPDFVWESAGKVTETGFQIEIKMPLSTLRFKSGEEVLMNIIFMRYISRLGKMGSYPEIKSGQSQFTSMIPIMYKNLKKTMKLEILPSFTWQMDKERIDRETWGENYSDANFGLSLKYGLSSSIVGEATFNPDYSQIESDEFQVDVNQRYPIFYSEKRPFFMEGNDTLDFSIIKNGMMVSPVYTRNIVDPLWATKLSGTAGRTRFAILAAEEEAVGRLDGTGENAFFGIARAKYSMGKDNSIGVLYSGYKYNGNKNHAIGSDLQYRLNKNLRFSFSYLLSKTDNDLLKNESGFGINTMLEYSTKRLNAGATFEKYDKNFVMKSAFLRRNNFNRLYLYAAPNYYPNIKWMHKIQPFIRYFNLHDYEYNSDDLRKSVGVNMFFIKQGYARLEFNQEEETWMGIQYKKDYFVASGNIQLNKYINLYAYYKYGDQIDYYNEIPYLGVDDFRQISMIIQPGMRWTFNIQYYNDTFKKNFPDSKNEVYSIDILNFDGSYQFDEHFFVRCAFRYDDYNEKLVTDFLASYTIRPGTVAHLGYGTLYENKMWEEDPGFYGKSTLINTKKAIYFKISYLWHVRKQ